MPGGPHILDGEGVALDGNGRSDFNRFQDRSLPRRRPKSGADPVLFMAVDALMIDGEGLIGSTPPHDRVIETNFTAMRPWSRVAAGKQM